MTSQAVLCTGLAATRPRPVAWQAGFTGSRPCSWVPRRPPHPHTAGRVHPAFRLGSCCLSPRHFRVLGKRSLRQAALLPSLPGPPPRSISLKARAAAGSHCLSHDGVFWPVSPRRALLTPFSGASMPVRSGHTAQSGEVKGQAAGGRQPQPLGTQHRTRARITRPLTVLGTPGTIAGLGLVESGLGPAVPTQAHLSAAGQGATPEDGRCLGGVRGLLFRCSEAFRREGGKHTALMPTHQNTDPAPSPAARTEKAPLACWDRSPQAGHGLLWPAAGVLTPPHPEPPTQEAGGGGADHPARPKPLSPEAAPTGLEMEDRARGQRGSSVH